MAEDLKSLLERFKQYIADQNIHKILNELLPEAMQYLNKGLSNLKFEHEYDDYEGYFLNFDETLDTLVQRHSNHGEPSSKELDEILASFNQLTPQELYYFKLLTDFCLRFQNNKKLIEFNPSSFKKIELVNKELKNHFLKKHLDKKIELANLDLLYQNKLISTQSIYGKDPIKKDKEYAPFNPGFLSSLNLLYYSEDESRSVQYMTSQQKKKYKVRNEDGELKWGIKPYLKTIPDGKYLYIISPKGGLYCLPDNPDAAYQINQLLQHHSTIRSGKHILCGGHITINNN
jgi:hypothetical protein